MVAFMDSFFWDSEFLQQIVWEMFVFDEDRLTKSR
jgi:hypothetical protein